MAITWKQIKDSLGVMCPAGPEAIRFYLDSIQTVLFCDDGNPMHDDCEIFTDEGLVKDCAAKPRSQTAV
jgi:hypothetical protein